jgi:glycosyltransferase involved in cell wall biosynthesis
MKASICIATVPQKAETLRLVLESIFAQKPGFEFEVIVAHDGKPAVVDTRVKNLIVRTGGEYRNPSVARNVAMRCATGDVLILQSDDVVHTDQDMIWELVEPLRSDTFQLARVVNSSDGKEYVSRRRKRPYFFLGSVFRKDVCAIGGNCEEFTEPGYDDTWFADCLIYGRGLKPVFREQVFGTHLDHPRPDLTGPYERMRALYQRKVSEAQADSSKWIGGPAWAC